MSNLQSKYNIVIKKFETLLIFRNILCDEIVVQLLKTLKIICNSDTDRNIIETEAARLESLLINKAESKSFGGNILNEHLLDLVFTDENVFTLICELRNEDIITTLHSVAINDLKSIISIIGFNVLKHIEVSCGIKIYSINYIPIDYKKTTNTDFIATILKSKIGFNTENTNSLLEQKIAEELMIRLSHFCSKNGCGLIGSYKVFIYEYNKGLLGVKDYDNITFNQIIKYDYQKEVIISNTKNFINSLPAQNVLLTGFRGCGKSSCVKALVNEFHDCGLKLIELNKNQLHHLHELFNLLKNRGKKFIVFIDDLSFDENETQFKELKSVMEGGILKKPDNVLIYVTSNRLHIVQEKWMDRNSREADVHTSDALNEKISLSDRFGITLTFNKPTPTEYIEIVKGIAKNRNLIIDEEKLTIEAMKLELQKNMTGRTAKQLVDSL